MEHLSNLTEQQRQQRQVDQVPAYLNLPLGELETFMESFRSDKAWKTRKDCLALKTGELFCVSFHEPYRTYVGYEQLADEDFLRAYEEATVIKNAVLTSAKALTAERKSEIPVSSRIPSPSNAQ